ncbi:RDD family protein [Bacillus chungangensis]|uniref:RDD family membrane protein YckC n=1 Tax=Bacillus chungangensis TaxID=587633 RepID=A0ABT9X0D6_9BACI|nr:RDD family protein [Bacillus chungangensis]MDQ0178455.1 putative RDD family membrane protein YckC [Bacillus chungangensis]
MDRQVHLFNEKEQVPLRPNDQKEALKVHDEFKEEKYVDLAGFWMRFWAYLIDLLTIGSIVRLLIKPILGTFDIPLGDTVFFSPITITHAVVFYLYFILMTKLTGQTVGKIIFGLKVVSLKKEKLTWGTVIFRELFGRYISSTFFNLLYIIVAFVPKKQGIHDSFADTIVIHERSSQQIAFTRPIKIG